MFRKNKSKKSQQNVKENLNAICPFLYVDIFGHPYCTAKIEKAIECKYGLPSEEYVEMKSQLEKQKKILKNNVFKVPSTYRCTKLDKYADKEGHLPRKYRAKLPEGMEAITGFFE